MIAPHSAAAAGAAALAASSAAARTSRTSEPQGGAVAAWVGAAEHGAVAEADRVRVAGAREERGRRPDRVTLAHERRGDRAGHAALEVDGVGRLAGQEGADQEARPLDRLLRVDAV